jgi:hypothetical protein
MSTDSGTTRSGLEVDGRGWPILHSADEICDGTHPFTGRTCARGYHQGYHRDDSGAEWLDE